MALTKLPYDKDLVMYAGATFLLRLRWTAGGEPVDLTGWDAWMPFGTSLDDPMQELTYTDGEIQLDSEGNIVIEVAPERTAELALLDIPTKSGTGVLEYNLTLKDPFGTVWRFMRGKIFIEHDVQRPK